MPKQHFLKIQILNWGLKQKQRQYKRKTWHSKDPEVKYMGEFCNSGRKKFSKSFKHFWLDWKVILYIYLFSVALVPFGAFSMQLHDKWCGLLWSNVLTSCQRSLCSIVNGLNSRVLFVSHLVLKSNWVCVMNPFSPLLELANQTHKCCKF